MDTIPEKGRPYGEILAELERFGSDDPNYKDAKTWSLVYYLDKDYTDFLLDAYGRYFSANGLNPTAFKSLKRLEKAVLRFTAGLLHADDSAYGVMTSCGTESCLLAVKTYRDLGRSKGIKKPEMVLPETAHVAWEKGAEYFGVTIQRAPLAGDYGVDLKDVERLVNKNTVMILGSAPEYPHGIIDPIKGLGELAVKRKIPLHVDACVGGYLLPFLEENGADIPVWDFRVPGVSSISADIHKYGYAAKGASCILYRSGETFRHQVFVSESWPGGVFASPALLGTRPGGAYAAAWAAIQANGREGYRELARRAMETTEKLKKGIEAIPELEIIGSPTACLLSFRSNNPNVNIFAVGDEMEKAGWHIDRLQRPDALHAMVTAAHGKAADLYLQDLARAVCTVAEHPELAESGQAATYGMISHIPLRRMVRKQVLDMFAASYKLSAGEIDLSDSASLAPGSPDSKGASKKSFTQKMINRYVKRRSGKR